MSYRLFLREQKCAAAKYARRKNVESTIFLIFLTNGNMILPHAAPNDGRTYHRPMANHHQSFKLFMLYIFR
jgi:hypothetical protein